MTPFATVFEAMFNALEDAGDDETPKPRRGSTNHYRSRKTLLTPTEARFFDHLRQVLPPEVHICPKVRLCDVLDPFDNGSARKHLDFVLCSFPSLTILGAIELDDPTHEREDRQQRDKFLSRAMKAARVPLIRIRSRRAYDREYLLAALYPILT